jgi:hypothetical protein
LAKTLALVITLILASVLKLCYCFDTLPTCPGIAASLVNIQKIDFVVKAVVDGWLACCDMLRLADDIQAHDMLCLEFKNVHSLSTT